MFRQFPDSQILEDIDPIMKLWMFHNWWADQMDQAELAKNTAYLIGSFWNPEAVKQLTGEGINQHISSDSDFEKTSEWIKKDALQSQSKHRRRKHLKD